MKIEVMKLEALKPLEKNVRKHNEKQINELIRSLEAFGQTRAIIVDEDNNILIGNGLFMAMKARGDETAECSRVTGLTEKAKKKLILSDNKVFSLGADDYEAIQDFINEITIDGDFDIAGFDDDILKAMSRSFEEVAQDVADYGKIPEGYVKQREEPEAPAERATVTQQPASYKAAEPVSRESDNVAIVKNDRTIICPSCGEVIHLD